MLPLLLWSAAELPCGGAEQGHCTSGARSPSPGHVHNPSAALRQTQKGVTFEGKAIVAEIWKPVVGDQYQKDIFWLALFAVGDELTKQGITFVARTLCAALSTRILGTPTLRTIQNP